MESTDNTIREYLIPQKTVTVEECWEKLKSGNLTSRERVMYQHALARRASIDEENEAYEEIRQKTIAYEQKAEAIRQRTVVYEQKTEAIRQRTIAYEQKTEVIRQQTVACQQETKVTEQKAKEAQQKRKAAEQKISSAIKKLLQEGIFTDKRIAEILSVDIEDVQQIKNGLEN